MVVEVTSRVDRADKAIWAALPDFMQLRWYMNELNAPGILIDAQSIFLVNLGADEPYAEIRRSDATWDDLVTINEMVNTAWEAKNSDAGNTAQFAADSSVLDEWKRLPNSDLPSTTSIAGHFLDQLQNLLIGVSPRSEGLWISGGDPYFFDATLGPFIESIVHSETGRVDYAIGYGGVQSLALLVKLEIDRPTTGRWTDSSDFRELRRMMVKLDTPGLLMDRQRILLVGVGKERPFAVITRAEASWADIAIILGLMLESSSRKNPSGSEPRVALPRRIAWRG